MLGDTGYEYPRAERGNQGGPAPLHPHCVPDHPHELWPTAAPADTALDSADAQVSRIHVVGRAASHVGPVSVLLGLLGFIVIQPRGGRAFCSVLSASGSPAISDR